MFLEDFHTLESNKKLIKLRDTLQKEFGVDLDIYFGLSESELSQFIKDLENRKKEIIFESDFNSYYQNPEYTRTSLLLEALRVILREIAPKRLSKKHKGEIESSDVVEGTKHNNTRYVSVVGSKTDGTSNTTVMSIDPVTTSDNEISLFTKVNESKKEVDNMTAKSKVKSLSALLENSLLVEGELERAELVLATKELVNRLQKMIEDLGKMAIDDIMPLVDGLKNEYGQEEAEKFGTVAEEKLQSSASAIQEMKDVLDQYSEKLEGHISDEDTQNIANDMIDISTDGEDTEADLVDPELAGEVEKDDEADADDILSGDEINASDEPLGRAKKESKIIAIGGKKVRLNEQQIKSLIFAKNVKKVIESKGAKKVRFSQTQTAMLNEAKAIIAKINTLTK